jgi:imidazolonepropionase-like amidohydrolase
MKRIFVASVLLALAAPFAEVLPSSAARLAAQVTDAAMMMSELEALRTATIYAPDLLDTPDRGALSVGMLADIIAVPGNPLDDITVTKDVRFVMLGGNVVKHVMGGHDMHSGGR